MLSLPQQLFDSLSRWLTLTPLQMCNLPDEIKPAKIILIGRTESKLQAKGAQLKAANVPFVYYICDLSLPRIIIKTLKTIVEKESDIGLMCLNAGTWIVKRKRHFQEDGLEQMYATNFLHMAMFIEGLKGLMTETAKRTQTKSRICIST